MGLTVAEKNHWKDRIASKIAKKKAQIIAENDPTYKAKVEAEARDKILADAGLTERYAEVVKLEAAHTKAQEEYSKAVKQLRLDFTGETPRNYYQANSLESLNEDITERAKGLISSIMAESPLGKQLLRLDEESDNILDTVWLATSPQQIKDLWGDVAALLGEKPTPLQLITIDKP